MTAIDSIMDHPPMERQRLMVTAMQQLQHQVKALRVESKDVDLAAKRKVSDVATENDVAERTMLRQLRDAGAKPFKLGRIWWVREVHLVEVYETLEKDSAI